MRTTYGSPIFRDHVPTEDTLVVARLRRAGAIVIGKTNTPEFGAGSQTFNPVFGPTRNPYDLARTPGGSSGGAAAAVASGMVPLADGSDLGGEHPQPRRRSATSSGCARRPVACPRCRRPTRGTRWACSARWRAAWRTPRCCCGRWPAPTRARRSRSTTRRTASCSAPTSTRAGARIAWSRNLGDLPVEPEVTAVLEDARAALEAMGCIVEDVEPDLTGADEAFEVLRGIGFAHAFGALLETRGEELKDTIVWNTRFGLSLTGARVAHALALQTEMFHRMRALLERYDALALPVSQVAPFPVEREWVERDRRRHDGLLPRVDARRARGSR